MGIEAVLLDEQGHETARSEFASIGGFYNLAHLMGMLLPAMRSALANDPHGWLKRAIDWFDDYVSIDTESADQAFVGYCEFTSQAADHILSEHPPANLSDLDHMRANPDDFSPAIRVFFGRFVFGEKSSSPEEAENIAWFGRGMLGIIAGTRLHYEHAGEDDVVYALNDADVCLRSLVEACEKAAETGCWIGFDA